MSVQVVGITVLLAFAALGTGCAAVVPTTNPADVSHGRPGYVIGYLKPADLPDSRALLPPPPAARSAALADDEEAYRITRELRDTPRWQIAAKDADLGFPAAASTFTCELGMPISESTTPHLNMLLLRVLADTSQTNDKAKDHYQRQRPYKLHADQSCTPQHKQSDDSYPSTHAAVGWAWALLLAEIAPDRANAILARGLAFGQSRVVCGVHWKSDVEAGRLVGAAVVSRLHADPEFEAQLNAAQKEIERSHAAGAKPTLDCAAQARALEIKP